MIILPFLSRRILPLTVRALTVRINSESCSSESGAIQFFPSLAESQRGAEFCPCLSHVDLREKIKALRDSCRGGRFGALYPLAS